MKREYWESPEVFEFEADVTRIDDKKVTISPNFFHPEEGGQPADKGMIGDAAVEMVTIENERIILTLSKDINDGKHPAKIDIKHRLFTSRHHTAQHIISGIAEHKFGLKTVGVHIGETVTIEFDKEITWDISNQLEILSNEVVMSDYSVDTSYGEGETRFKEVLAGIDSENIRVVSISDIDSSACCGAHVPRTGNVGFIKITNIEKKRTGSRITYNTGLDAVMYSQKETEVLRNLRKHTSCSDSELEKKVTGLLDDVKQKNRELNSLWTKMIPTLIENCEVIDYNNSKIGLIIEKIPGDVQNKLTAMLLNGFDVSVVISEMSISVSSKSVSAKEILQKITQTIGGKGGGNEKTSRGKLEVIPKITDIIEVFQD